MSGFWLGKQNMQINETPYST